MDTEVRVMYLIHSSLMLRTEKYVELIQTKQKGEEWQGKAFQGKKITYLKAERHKKAITLHITI